MLCEKEKICYNLLKGYKNKKLKMRKKINTFFLKKITIARWQFNLFGLACFSVGATWGVYLMVSGAFPKMFAADSSPIIKTAESPEFINGTLSATAITGVGIDSVVRLGAAGSWAELDNRSFTVSPIGDSVTDENGNIFVMNGDSSNGDEATKLWKFDASTHEWTMLATPPFTSDFTSMTYDGNGNIFVARNRSMYPYPTWTDQIWKYVIATNEWVYLTNAPANIVAGVIVSDKKGNLFVHTGSSDVYFYKYDIVTNQWIELQSIPEATTSAKVEFVFDDKGNTDPADDKEYIFMLRNSGDGGFNFYSDFWRYDIGLNTWATIASLPETASYNASLEYDQNGNLYALGSGYDIWKYDIASDIWSSTLGTNSGVVSMLSYNAVEQALYVLGVEDWVGVKFFRFNLTAPTSGSFELDRIETKWNAGWADVDSFNASVNVPVGTTLTFSIKAALSGGGLSDVEYVPLVGSIGGDNVFRANLKDPNGDLDLSDAIPTEDYRYLKIKVEFETADAAVSPELKSITLNYTEDTVLPDVVGEAGINMNHKMFTGDTEDTGQLFPIANGGWTGRNGDRYDSGQQYYYLNWVNAQDSLGKVVGYCLSVSYDSAADPVTTGGLLHDSNADNGNNGYNWWGLPSELINNNDFLDEQGSPKCRFILKKQDLPGDLTELKMKEYIFNYGTPWNLGSFDKPYYLNIKTIDASGNVSSGMATFSFKVDVNSPRRPAYFTGPGSFISDKNDAVISWPVNNEQAANDLWDAVDEVGNQIYDIDGKQVKVSLSGVAGYQYCIGDDCDNADNWYGLNHNGSITDLIPANQGSYRLLDDFGNGVMVPLLDESGNPVLDANGDPQMEPDGDHRRLKEGVNHVWLRVCDNAGNCSDDNDIRMRTDIKINTVAPSPPENLAVTPNTSQNNSYAFSWTAPSLLNGYLGSVDKLRYCYTVNKIPSLNNCTFTTPGALSLVADAFATQPGENTFYIASKGEGGEINYADYASVNFTYDGTPPTEPVSVDVADISIKSKSDWKLVVSWSPPENAGAGVALYRIFRSETQATCAENPSVFEEIGSTAGTSFADVGLAQKMYYYCVKAYDSANSSINRYSNTVSRTPDGKFTEPAIMIDGPEVSDITTSKALISWTTDRNSDSKVSFGKKSNDYYTEEPSNSEQSPTHKIQLNSLDPGTTYFYRAKWTDEDGNTGESSEKSFKTEAAPTVKDVKAEDIGINSAFVRFTTKGASKAKIYYGESAAFGSAKEISTSNKESEYNFVLSSLNDDTKYYYKINTFDAEGEEYEGTTLDFTTLPRPKISNVEIQPIKDSAQPGVQVTWQSNTEISSIVSYAPTNNAADKQTEVEVDLISGDHEATIMNLKPLTTYELVVRGVDRAGNEASSDLHTFTTASDTRPPQISEIVVEGSGSKNQNDKLSQLTVSWNTDEPATSQVEFGEGVGTSYTQRTQEDGNLTNNHLVIISGLTPSKVYHLRIVSKDQVGNLANSPDTVSITPKAVDSAFELVVGNLMEVFGFLRGFQN